MQDAGKQDHLANLLYNSKTVYNFGWITYVVHGLRLFSGVQNENVCLHIRYVQLFHNSFSLYHSKENTVVEANFSVCNS